MADTTQSDFAQVRLTAKAQKAANGGPMTISNGRRSYTFTGAEPQKVERSYELNAWLSQHVDADGDPYVELVPDAPAKQPAKTAADTTPAPATT